MEKKMKLFIIGGHLTPAMAVGEELGKRGYEIIYLGRKFAYAGEKTVSVEYTEIKNLGWRFLHLPAGKIPRYFSWEIITNVFLIPVSFLTSLIYLILYRPAVVISFGGYMAVAPVIVAKMLGISTITHEQTLTSGLANQIIARFCDKICLSWPTHYESLINQLIKLNKNIKSKIILTGNPLRKEIFVINQSYDLPLDRPLLYITGGNLGSHSINLAVAPIIAELLKSFNIIHQCGSSQKFNDLGLLTDIKTHLKSNLQKRYQVVPFVDSKHIGWVLKNTQLMVSRAGANTVFEVIRFAIPTLFIPLPWAGANEQLKHAKFLRDNNAALMLEQKQLTPNKLKEQISILYTKRKKIKIELMKLSKDVIPDAARRISDVVQSIS